MESDSWEKEIERGRKEKDEFFGVHWQSPISPEERIKFNGLDYYPPDQNYRFEIELVEHADKEVLEIEDTKGNVRRFLRWGEFHFTVGNKECVLQAYKDDPNDDRLFIPFKDETNGKETYGAGRYLDLEYERDHTKNGKWIVDLNKAYNPWCAYSKNYACPYVPPENWLKVSIKAGEKQYPLKG